MKSFLFLLKLSFFCINELESHFLYPFMVILPVESVCSPCFSNFSFLVVIFLLFLFNSRWNKYKIKSRGSGEARSATSSRTPLKTSLQRLRQSPPQRLPLGSTGWTWCCCLWPPCCMTRPWSAPWTCWASLWWKNRWAGAPPRWVFSFCGCDAWTMPWPVVHFALVCFPPPSGGIRWGGGLHDLPHQLHRPHSVSALHERRVAHPAWHGVLRLGNLLHVLCHCDIHVLPR